MKKNHYLFLLTSFMALVFLGSCTSTKYGAHFQPGTNHSYAQQEKEKKAEPVLLAQQEKGSSALIETIAERSGATEEQTDATLPSVESLKKGMPWQLPSTDELSLRQQEVLQETKEYLQRMSPEERRALKREIRNLKLSEYQEQLPAYAKELGVQQEDVSENELVILLLTILLPPLGVYLHQGEINNKFWITLVLWLIFYIPGLIYGLFVVLDE